jgi:hypothetical protein
MQSNQLALDSFVGRSIVQKVLKVYTPSEAGYLLAS